jgi:hypothetical protein
VNSLEIGNTPEYADDKWLEVPTIDQMLADA